MKCNFCHLEINSNSKCPIMSETNPKCFLYKSMTQQFKDYCNEEEESFKKEMFGDQIEKKQKENREELRQQLYRTSDVRKQSWFSKLFHKLFSKWN